MPSIYLLIYLKINLFNPQHGEYIKAKTESFVVGKDVKDPNMVNKLFETLAGKTQPDDNIENASQEFRSGPDGHVSSDSPERLFARLK